MNAAYNVSLTWSIDDHPGEETVLAVRRKLAAYNVATAAIDSGQELAILCRNNQGTLMGGATGTVWGKVVEVNHVWVHSRLRGRGYGSRLLLTLEREAKSRESHTSLLDTFSFQAPGFYRHLGYEVFGVIDGYPSGYKKYFLHKRL